MWWMNIAVVNDWYCEKCTFRCLIKQQFCQALLFCYQNRNQVNSRWVQSVGYLTLGYFKKFEVEWAKWKGKRAILIVIFFFCFEEFNCKMLMGFYLLSTAQKAQKKHNSTLNCFLQNDVTSIKIYVYIGVERLWNPSADCPLFLFFSSGHSFSRIEAMNGNFCSFVFCKNCHLFSKCDILERWNCKNCSFSFFN